MFKCQRLIIIYFLTFTRISYLVIGPLRVYQLNGGSQTIKRLINCCFMIVERHLLHVYSGEELIQYLCIYHTELDTTNLLIIIIDFIG